MFPYTLALGQAGPRLGGSAVSIMIIALVLAAAALVFWASRPSVTGRRSAAPRPGQDTPAAPVKPEDHA